MAAPAHDPRIGQILDSLEQVHAIQQTDLSPDGNLIAWNAGGIEVAPLNDPSHPKPITACAAGEKGRESGFAWSPDSKQLAFFSNCTPDHKPAIFLASPGSDAAPRLLATLNGFAKEPAMVARRQAAQLPICRRSYPALGRARRHEAAFRRDRSGRP